MNTNLLVAAVFAVAGSAFAQFRFDPSTGACVNAAGERGLNVGVRGPCGDLSNQNLEDEHFAGDFRGARFDGAKLKGTSFRSAQLSKASFVGADLTGAVLTSATLDGAVLTQARLVGAHLDYAQLTGASLAGADLRNAYVHRAVFSGADLRTAVFSKTKCLLGGARWENARVLADTLPFDSNELATRRVTVLGELAALVR